MKESFGLRAWIIFRNSATLFAHRFDSHGYRA